MTEIEIEVYSSDNSSEEEEDNFEYSYQLITPNNNFGQCDEIEDGILEHKNNFTSKKENKYLHKSQKNYNFGNGNENFSTFISRQNAANKRQLKNRDNPPNERRFNPPPFQFVLQSAIPPPKPESSKGKRRKSTQNHSLFQRSIHQNSPTSFEKNSDQNISPFQRSIHQNSPISSANNSDQNLFDEKGGKLESKIANKHSVLNDEIFNFEINDFDIIDKKSEIIANEKIVCIINNTCGDKELLDYFQLCQILHKFMIKEKLLVDRIRKITEKKLENANSNTPFQCSRLENNNDTFYDNEILKSILIHSVEENKLKNLSSLEKQIRTCVFSSLKNDRSISKKGKL